MATTVLALRSERWLDELVMQATVADVGGTSISEHFSLPVGIGDVALMNLQVGVSTIATVPVAATIDRGARAVIVSSDATTVVDSVGVAQFFATQGDGAAFTRVDCFFDPDALVLWRQGELLHVVAPEMDANAAPTGDVVVVVKAVRVRPIEGAVTGPMRLVNVTDM